MTARLAPDEVLETPRLRLSPVHGALSDRLAPWLEAALAPEWRPADLDAAFAAGHGRLIATEADEAIGAAVVQLDQPVAGAASLSFIAIAPGRRFRGLGAEAALAIERRLRERHAVETVYAPVPDGRGLALYFWLRLGYRPLLGVQAPWPLVGLTSAAKAGVWLCRDGRAAPPEA